MNPLRQHVAVSLGRARDDWHFLPVAVVGASLLNGSAESRVREGKHTHTQVAASAALVHAARLHSGGVCEPHLPQLLGTRRNRHRRPTSASALPVAGARDEETGSFCFKKQSTFRFKWAESDLLTIGAEIVSRRQRSCSPSSTLGGNWHRNEVAGGWSPTECKSDLFFIRVIVKVLKNRKFK